MPLFNQLRTRLMLIVALASVPLLLFSLYGYVDERQSARAATEQRILDLLKHTLAPESIVFDNTRQVLRIMALSSELVTQDAVQCSGLAKRLLRTQTNFSNLGAVLPDGKVFCSGLASTGAVDVTDRQWFASTVEQKKMSQGQLLIGRISGERSLTFGFPLFDDDGALRAVLYSALRLDWINRLVEAAPLAPGWIAAAYGHDGFIVARYPDVNGLQGQIPPDHDLIRFIRTRPVASVRELQGPDGVRRIYGIAPLNVANGDIYLVVGAPPDVVNAASDQRLIRSIWLTLVVGSLSFLLAWVGVRRDFLVFSKALRQSFQRLAVGTFDVRLGYHGKVAELSDIASGFDHMAGQLQNLAAQHERDSAAQRLAVMVFEASAEGIMITDTSQRILQVNPRLCELTGYSPEEIIGQNPRVLQSGVQGPEFYKALWESIGREGRWQGEVVNQRKDGAHYVGWLSISLVRDAAGAVQYYIGQFSDLTQKKALDERVTRLLNFDALTGLPNRSLFVDRLQQSMLAAERSGSGVAVFWIDLVRFRVLNDTFGHATGDMVLVEVGRRLARVARAGDSAARLSADEFGLVMTGFEQETDIGTLAQRVIDAIRAPIELEGAPIVIDVNIGISVFPKDGLHSDDLLKGADVALARAKGAGRGTFRFFAPGMDLIAERRLRLEAELRGALDGGQLALYYQPQIDLATGRACGTEALMRWTHPVLGPISPVEFIPLAEEVGLIQPIGAWALVEACRQNKRWIDSGLPALPVAVNLSPRQFHQADLVEFIAATLAETGLPPALLELELTETAFIGDVMDAAQIIHRIKGLGVLLALDDFGTGYSSLSYLSGFPFDKIKIDQSFVHDVTSNPVNAAIATATIAMARSLNLVVLAEGVETDAQMNFLRMRRCEAMQGHLFSKALPVDQLTALLSAGHGLKVGVGDTATQRTLLLVDDEPNILSSLKRLLRRDGYQVLTAESPEIAFDLLAQHDVQVIISDQRMPSMSGTEFLSRAKKLYPNTVRMILSGYTDLDSVTDAINRGAIYRFLTKPWDDEKLRADIHEAFRVAQGFASG